MGIADDVKNLGDDIVVSYNARVKAIGAIVNDTRKTLKGFHAEHQEMSAQQAKDLSGGETDRLKTFKGMMGDIRKDINDIETYVKNKLQEFSEAHAEMSVELKKELAKYVDDMVKATKKLMDEIQARQKERNAQVADLLEAYKTEREKMAANWQNLVATMAKKRGVEPVEVEAGAEVKTVEKAVVKPAVGKGRKKGKGKKK